MAEYTESRTYFVAREKNVGAINETGADHVGERVVFLVEGENGGGWDT